MRTALKPRDFIIEQRIKQSCESFHYEHAHILFGLNQFWERTEELSKF